MLLVFLVTSGCQYQRGTKPDINFFIRRNFVTGITEWNDVVLPGATNFFYMSSNIGCVSAVYISTERRGQRSVFIPVSQPTTAATAFARRIIQVSNFHSATMPICSVQAPLLGPNPQFD